MGISRCHWVRDRLPLLAGGDLCGLDRRRVERHLIGCPQCRQHQAALGRALEVLQTVAASSPSSPDAPSLWPALARQIRESRRPAPTPTFPFALAWPWPRVALRLALGLGLLAALGVGLAVRTPTHAVQPRIAAGERPVAPVPVALTPRQVEVVEAKAPEVKSKLKPKTMAKPRREPERLVEAPPVYESSPHPRFDYDLDHGRPMAPDTREGRDPRATYSY
jgi:anti-sigma factor RsiW